MSEFLLELKNVSKFFGYGFVGWIRFPAVDDVSLNMENEPKILTIAGESGCGKTTLARIILGLLKPDEGIIFYKGKNVYSLKLGERKLFRKEVQAIFQDPYGTFNPLKNVDEYLFGTAKHMLNASGEEASVQIKDSLKFVGLTIDEVAGKKPSELSGGQLQRVAIARALLPQPRLLVADEPVSMIDASSRMNILNIFKESKQKGISFVYITHDLATAYYISDEIAIMYRGMIIERGPAEEVLLNQYHPYTRALVSSLPEHGKREKWIKEEINPLGMEIREFLASGCKYVSMCPNRMEKCLKERPSMFESGKAKVACWLYE